MIPYTYISVATVDPVVTPTTPLPPIVIPRGGLVVVGGRGPIWRYGLLLHKLHGSAAGAVAVYDPKKGAVIVQSHSTEYVEGQILPLTKEDWKEWDFSANFLTPVE